MDLSLTDEVFLVAIKKWAFRLLAVCVVVKAIGLLLDSEAERVTYQAYDWDQHGRMTNLPGEIVLHSNEKKAVVMVPGYLDSTLIFQELAQTVAKKLPIAVYVPEMPHVAGGLTQWLEFNNEENLKFLGDYIKKVAAKHSEVHVLGLSYGAVLTIELRKRQILPKNLHYIFYGPALFIKLNIASIRAQIRAYLLWRRYCNYEALGCKIPSYGSGDEGAREFIRRESTSPFNPLSPYLELFDMDSNELRSYYRGFPEDYHLLIAKDDNRVDFTEHERICNANKHCKLTAFPSGSHLVHIGSRKQEFAEKVVQILETP